MQPATQRQLVQGKFPVQRQAPEEDDMLQGKFALQRQAPEEDDMLQGKFALQRQAPEEDDMLQGKMTATVQKKDESNNGIPHEVQAKMETAMNADFSNVQLHPNSSKAPEVGALAYTQGNDIHFAPGQFSPDTSSGRQLLGHELAHVVQQREGRVQPTTEVAGMPVNDNPALESEADKMGAKGV
ncbi:MAG: DUF4157 domain-containing protein [Deltaproteobacteria bacterium]|nr:DUF4157 domain-containing protein [Deltaproteobacteria bacterium]